MCSVDLSVQFAWSHVAWTFLTSVKEPAMSFDILFVVSDDLFKKELSRVAKSFRWRKRLDRAQPL